MHRFQRTLKRRVSCTGIGLHSGKKVNMRLRPAEPDSGIMFKRSDLPGAPLIPADVHHVVDTTFCTTLGVDGVTVSTVEHLLSALAGFGLDNVLVDLDAPEVPIMDGSSAPFVFLLRNAGLTSQSKPRQYYRVKRKVSVKDNDKEVSVAPSPSPKLDYTIEFDHPLIRRQTFDVPLDERTYDREISRARTFGFLSDLPLLKQHNLGLGGSLDNAVVVDKYRVLNDDGLRFPDEFVRHKILDFIGDLALVGRPVVGAFTAHKSGHKLNNMLFRSLLDDPQAWQLVTPPMEQLPLLSADQERPPQITQAVA